MTDLQGSKVRFKFKATATAHQTPITIDGMTFTLNADGESYSLTSYSAPATPSGLYRGVRRLIVDTLTIPSTVDGAPVTELAEYCLNGAMVKNVIIPNTVVSIGTEAFEDDAYLESVSMPDSVRSIGISAFNGCEKLAAFHVPTSLSTLGALAFENTKALQAFDFDGNASFGISPDKTLILTADGTSIVASAAGALAVSIPSTVTQIPDRVLMSLVSMKTLTIPASVISILVSDNAWTALTDVYYLGTMAQWSNVSKLDGWLLNGSTVSVVHCSDGDTANVETKNLEYVLNEGGTGYAVSIGSADTNAVEQYGLFVPTVHNGLPIAEIPNDAFSSWAMPKAILPNAITKIGDFAFFDCSLGSINIPTSVVSIGISAFWEGSLTSVVFPVSLTSIGQEAFENNTSLASITYQGTKAQWAAVSKGTNWAGGVPSTTVITCTDGTVALS
jgi:hypothetical protein